MPNFVEEGRILLPEFLFYPDDSKSKSVSLAASLNPATAAELNKLFPHQKTKGDY
jgi:hypothetical protein